MTSRSATFRATVELGGKTATGICVPDDVVAGLGAGRKPAVVVTVGEHTYRSTVAVMGGRSMIPLSAEHRGLAGVSAGDDVEVHLELDDAPRVVTVPDDLAAALDEDDAARTFFHGLSSSQQRWFVSGIEEAKKPETRAARITRAVARLHEGRGQR